MKKLTYLFGLCLALAGMPSDAQDIDELPGPRASQLGLSTVFIHRATVIDVCGETASAPSMACEALVLGLFNGFLYGTLYGDYVHCMPEQVGPDKLVPVFVTYVRTEGGADVEHAGSLMLDMIEALGWGGHAGEACLAQAAADDAADASDDADPDAEPGDPLDVRVANADAGEGEQVFRMCSACHAAEADGRAQIGPHLWGIVDRPVASVDGFPYSNAMIGHGETIGTWSLAELDVYLASPRDAVPGTISGFRGVRNPADRIDLLAYLMSLAAE